MKTIKTFAFAVLALAMSFATTSCNKDDAGTASVSTTKIETSSQTPQKETAKANPTLAFSYYISQDVMDLYDLSLTYTDANGEQKTEEVKAENGKKYNVTDGSNKTALYVFDKSITFTKKPISNVKYKLNIQQKATPLVQKDSYNLCLYMYEKASSESIVQTLAESAIVWNVADGYSYTSSYNIFLKAKSGSYTLTSDGNLVDPSTRGHRLFY